MFLLAALGILILAQLVGLRGLRRHTREGGYSVAIALLLGLAAVAADAWWRG